MLDGSRRQGNRRPAAPAHRHRRRSPRLSRYSVAHPQAHATDPTVAGRWSALPLPEPDSTLRAHFSAELLLGRYGVLTKGSVATEGVPGGFATLYKVLTTLEDAGRCQRGYFVESLGGAQFAAASTVDRLRSFQDSVDPDKPAYRAVALAAADPANPYGSALPWPARGDEDNAHRPGRKAGALVVLVDGELVWFLERGGRSLLNFAAGGLGAPPARGGERNDSEVLRAAAGALAELVSAARVDAILVEKVDGVPVLDPQPTGDRAAVAAALVDAGFARTPRGLRLR
jgi:ATP-dependent Lhr-like helicase